MYKLAWMNPLLSSEVCLTPGHLPAVLTNSQCAKYIIVSTLTGPRLSSGQGSLLTPHITKQGHWVYIYMIGYKCISIVHDPYYLL